MYIILNYRADLARQFPGVLNRSASDVEEAIYNKSRSEVSVCMTVPDTTTHITVQCVWYLCSIY